MNSRGSSAMYFRHFVSVMQPKDAKPKNSVIKVASDAAMLKSCLMLYNRPYSCVIFYCSMFIALCNVKCSKAD